MAARHTRAVLSRYPADVKVNERCDRAPNRCAQKATIKPNRIIASRFSTNAGSVNAGCGTALESGTTAKLMTRKITNPYRTPPETHERFSTSARAQGHK